MTALHGTTKDTKTTKVGVLAHTADSTQNPLKPQRDVDGPACSQAGLRGRIGPMRKPGKSLIGLRIGPIPSARIA